MNDQINQSTYIDISDLDKAEVLAALYNDAAPMGLGYLMAVPGDMTADEAREFLEIGDDHYQTFAAIRGHRLYFDYLNGRCMKVDLTNDAFNPAGYDREYGEGAAAGIINRLRQAAGADQGSTE